MRVVGYRRVVSGPGDLTIRRGDVTL